MSSDSEIVIYLPTPLMHIINIVICAMKILRIMFVVISPNLDILPYLLVKGKNAQHTTKIVE